MGSLSYDGMEYPFEDRTLQHLQVVITTKLRRRESFAFSWVPAFESAGRETIWIDNGLPLRFRYDEPAVPAINRDWLEVLMEGTHRPSGLTLLPEPPAKKARQSSL
ncbi:hypothetical protein [Leifsonia sp. NPDC080035]|uniref:DUF7882 domain-containing protein n=1 Tax=Leifsonia sp. NPDC080035 TaxID=3143936 RepID=A0AAU7GFW9_9MICO